MDKSLSIKGVGKKLRKPNNIMVIPTPTDTDFFKWWCRTLRMFVKLSDREIDLLASLLKYRWLLSQEISNPAILDSHLMSNETKKKIAADAGISMRHLYVLSNSLRETGVLIDNRINPRLIPNIRKDDNGVFQLLLLFKPTGAHGV